MITITRAQARRLRAVFRRHALGIAHKGAVPPLVLVAEPGTGLRVRHQQTSLAVECLVPGNYAAEEAIAVPLDALADFEGRDETAVAFEANAAGRTVARWDDKGIPQSRDYSVPDPAGQPPFPGPPSAVEACPADLLDALAEAALTTDPGSKRYALGCIQLRAATGEVVATDGRQVLIQSGFRLPGPGDALVPATPLFASRELPRDRPVGVARTDAHVMVRTGAWSAWLAIDREGRFPRVEHAVPDPHALGTRLRLAPQDAAFLADALGRLPGGEVVNAPVTLDLNGKAAVRAGAEDGSVTELVLGRSGYAGAAMRLVTNRDYLARALRLGFADIRFGGPEDPMSCRDGRRVYVWQPLSADAAIAASDDAVRIESTSAAPTSRAVEPPREAHSAHPRGQQPPNGADHPVAPSPGSGGGLASLIQEAVELHDALADAKARALRLAGALRRHRKQARLTQSTLAALRQLKLQEVAE